MYKVKFTTQYKKNYKLMVKRGKDMRHLEDVVYKLSKGESLDPKFKDHSLNGIFKGFRECHIEPDWLLIYHIEKDILTLTLVDTGSHSDLF